MFSPNPRGEDENGVEHHSPRLLILDDAAPGSSASSSEITSFLEARGYQVIALASGDEALQVLRRARPELLILAVGSTGVVGSNGREAEIRTAARDLGIPVLDLVDAGTDPGARIGLSEEADDWFVRVSPPEELAARVARLLRRREPTSAAATRPAAVPIDTRFSSLVVHDLRTPLNVIGLSLRMIEQVLPRDDPDVEEDLRFIDENFRQIERMLSQLGDYARLFEPGLQLSLSEFNPRRLVDELLENREARSGGKGSPVRLDVQRSCPAEATLDQGRARMAIEYALVNAGAAANDEPIRLTLRGGPQRWIIEVEIDRPPPSSVTSTEIRPQDFERLCGAAAERRGMDLAIAARVSELFGGAARLEAVEGRRTTVILDWPARIAGPPAAG